MDARRDGAAVEPRRRWARVAFACAALAAVAAVAVAVSGGVRADIGPLRVSARSAWPPLAFALVASIISLLLAPRAWPAHAVALGRWLDRRAGPLAALVALSTLVAGLALGSAVAAGADAAGYLAQADGWRRGQLRVYEPAAVEAPWPHATWTYAPLGFRPGRDAGELVPTYPPGLPLHFALAGAVAGDAGVRLVVPLLGAIGIWCTFLLGRRLATPFAGLAASALLATSPPWLQQLLQPMTDVPVTAWWLAALAVAAGGSGRRAGVTGLIAGAAWLVRPNLVLLLPLPLLPLVRPQSTADTSSATRVAASYAAGLAPAVLVLAWFNTSLYGAPWASGYGRAGELFSLSFVTTNLLLYAGWLRDVHAWLIAAAAVGAACLVARRRRPGAWLALPLVGLASMVVASYLVYAPFESWTYLRFLLPAIAVLAILAGVAMASVVSSRLPAAAPIALLLLVGLAGAALGEARGLGVFSTAAREQRYARAAAWVHRLAPAGTTLLAAQHSGSLRVLTGRPVVRWDLLDAGREPTPPATPWLEVAWTGATAATGGAAAVAWLVVDAEEEPAFRRRFASVSELGRLDWPPVASTDPPSPVRIYTLEGRTRYLAGDPIATVRIGPD